MKASARLVVAIAVTLVLACSAACDDKKDVALSSSAPTTTTSTALVVPSPSSPPSAHAPSSAHEPPTHVTAQHVLVAWKGAERSPKGVSRTKAEAKKRADEVAKKAREKGTDFSALVAEYSDDPGAKERQGSLGKFTREKMAKPFSDAAFALEVDAVSDPVETPFGFHVIKRNQ